MPEAEQPAAPPADDKPKGTRLSRLFPYLRAHWKEFLALALAAIPALLIVFHRPSRAAAQQVLTLPGAGDSGGGANPATTVPPATTPPAKPPAKPPVKIVPRPKPKPKPVVRPPVPAPNSTQPRSTRPKPPPKPVTKPPARIIKVPFSAPFNRPQPPGGGGGSWEP